MSRRSQLLTVRFSDAEFEELKALAAARNQSMSDYVRDRCTLSPPSGRPLAKPDARTALSKETTAERLQRQQAEAIRGGSSGYGRR